MADETVEVFVCGVDDLKNGEMREFEVGDGKVLLIKDNDTFNAISPKCTHYNAPLSKGSYANGHVRCPWHGACFDVNTGDIEDFPGLDSLHKFQVDIVDGKVKITSSQEMVKNMRRQKAPGCSVTDPTSILIIGGGGAAAGCAETLRQEGFKGKITMATKESYLPYDRPRLSKQLKAKPEELALRKADFYESNCINIEFNKEASGVDTAKQTVMFKDGDTKQFDKLFIATGGLPRNLSVPGNDLENVFLIRTPDDSNSIAAQIEGKDVVIVGTSFIGMEGAGFATGMGKAKSVTVIGTSDLPFENSLGSDIGKMYKNFHEKKGAKFYGKTSVKEFVGGEGRVKEVVLLDGTTIPADICLLGIGVTPSTAFLKGSGIKMSNRGYITVNKKMQTNIEDIYSGGDIVEFPLFMRDDENTNVQHWQMALQHGRIAAFNMVGKEKEIKSVPFFWTMQAGKSLLYTGYGMGYDDIVIHGDLEEMKFAAFFTKGDKVIAVAGMNYDNIVPKAAEMFLIGNILKDEIKADPFSWVSRL